MIVMMEFEWDDAKAEQNLADHRLSFDDAVEACAASISEHDGEARFRAVGCIGDRIFTVVYTERGGARRIISARRAAIAVERHDVDNSPHA
jgi:uncharacterized protein